MDAMRAKCSKSSCICQCDGKLCDPSANAADQQHFQFTFRAYVHNNLKYWMTCAIQLVKKETCVRVRQLSESIFRCILSPRLELFSSTQELSSWAEFSFEEEQKDYADFSKSIRNNTGSDWACNVHVWFNSIHTKLEFIHNTPKTTIQDVIAFKIQQYRHLW